MERKKVRPPRHLAELFIWRDGLGIFRRRYSIKLSKNKLGSKVIKYHQCSLERFYAVSVEVNSKFLSRPSTF